MISLPHSFSSIFPDGTGDGIVHFSDHTAMTNRTYLHPRRSTEKKSLTIEWE